MSTESISENQWNKKIVGVDNNTEADAKELIDTAMKFAIRIFDKMDDAFCLQYNITEDFPQKNVNEVLGFIQSELLDFLCEKKPPSISLEPLHQHIRRNLYPAEHIQDESQQP